MKRAPISTRTHSRTPSSTSCHGLRAVLEGKVAIISGTASSMAAMACMFAREGAKLVIADVLEHEGWQVADAIGASARFEQLVLNCVEVRYFV